MRGWMRQEELVKIYDEAMESNNALVVKLIKEIWLLQDLCEDEKNENYRLLAKLHELRQQGRK